MRQVPIVFAFFPRNFAEKAAFLYTMAAVKSCNLRVIRIQPQLKPRFPHTSQDNCEKSRSDQLVYIRSYQRSIITMIAELLRRTMTKIRRLGHGKVRARIMAGFLVSGRNFAAMVRGMMRIKRYDFVTGPGTGYCGQVAAPRYYPPFDIHRQTPVF